MRIISGRWKGLALIAPVGDIARPTTDRVKESIFSLMGISWTGGTAVDLFGGSGALGLEAVSRGADNAIVIDKHPRSVAAIRENVHRCHAEQEIQIWRMDWEAGWRKIEEDDAEIGWIFVDPPYGQKLWDSVLQTLGQSAVNIRYGVVCEHPKSQPLPETAGRLKLWKTKVYGDIQVTLYQQAALELSPDNK